MRNSCRQHDFNFVKMRTKGRHDEKNRPVKIKSCSEQICARPEEIKMSFWRDKICPDETRVARINCIMSLLGFPIYWTGVWTIKVLDHVLNVTEFYGIDNAYIAFP